MQPLENRLANSTSGLACDVSLEVAARLLMAGSHRVATPAEIEAATEHGERQRRASEAAANGNDGKVTLKLSVYQRPSTGRKSTRE